ncbi:hypothetical protein EV127DRAFT_501865 [Xylaria flabelliformis]|nr:hypothetical protein EV127DRAFT_501865 [Xylaria flabelliformis]
MPTQTAGIFRTANSRSGPPVTTAVEKARDISTFALGSDTCGFTTGSTITCDYGNECVNIDSYRGCCATDAIDCNTAIYTNCLDYTEMPNAAMCGPQTLCCPLSKAYCATYGFVTDEQPGATFTHLQCAESPDFGELYAYPPEQETTTESSTESSIESSSTENITSTLAFDPVESTNSSSSHSVSSGTIAGAVVGGVIFLLLVIFGVFQFICRQRRQRKENTGPSENNAPKPSTENPDIDNIVSGGRLPSLSTTHEQQTHLPLSAFPRDKRRSVSSILRRSSFGPNWPLGPVNLKSSLSSHPVVDLEKRLSPSDPPPQPDSIGQTKISMTSALNKNETSSSVAPFLTLAVSPLKATGINNKRLIESGLYVNTGRRSSSHDLEPVSPLSAPYQGNDTREDQHSDFMSAQSISHDRIWREVGDSVSPISVNGADGQVSPLTVSPLESRRGSFRVL